MGGLGGLGGSLGSFGAELDAMVASNMNPRGSFSRAASRALFKSKPEHAGGGTQGAGGGGHRATDSQPGVRIADGGGFGDWRLATWCRKNLRFLRNLRKNL